MPSNVATHRALSKAKREFIKVDPDVTTAVDVGWRDFRDFGYFLAGLVHSVGTGAVDAFALLANPESGGSGTDVEVKSHALTNNPDAVSDYIWLECLASEVKQEGDTLRYVSASVELAVDTDEVYVYYEFGNPRFAQQNLTVEKVA